MSNLHNPRRSKPVRPRDREQASRVFQAFARQGFERTSIVMVADAMGVARQTVYNRFGGKQEALDWAVDTLSAASTEDARSHLANEALPTESALCEALVSWLGPLVELLGAGPHGHEVLGLGSPIRQRCDPNRMLSGISHDLSRFLQQRQVCSDPNTAARLTHLLTLAAKGALLLSRDVADFRRTVQEAICGAGFPTPAAQPAPALQTA